MSRSITNYQVRARSTARVATVLAAVAGAKAFVSRPLHGWVTVVDEASVSQDDSEVRKLGLRLSKALDAPVLSFRLIDSSVFEYRLFQAGKLVDEYSSNPEYFGKVPAGVRDRSRGRPGIVASIVDAGIDPEAVAKVLDRAEPCTFQDDRLTRLAKLLRISPGRSLAGLGAGGPGWRAVSGAQRSPLGEELVRAVEHEDADAVRGLLAQGAPADMRDRSGVSVLSLAASLGNRELVDQLLAAGARDDAALLVVNDPGVARKLIAAGARVNFKAQDGRTPIWSAVRGGRTEVVKLLLAAGVDAQQTCEIEYQAPRRKEVGRTLLMYAANGDVARSLVKAGADPNARDPQGMTPLMWAAFWGRLDVADALVRAGADAGVRTPTGETAEVVAKVRDRGPVVRFLRKVNKPGQTSGRVVRRRR